VGESHGADRRGDLLPIVGALWLRQWGAGYPAVALRWQCGRLTWGLLLSDCLSFGVGWFLYGPFGICVAGDLAAPL
jgi:hypothetical protein